MPFGRRWTESWPIQTMGYYSVLKSNELAGQARTGGNWDAYIRLRGRGPSGKAAGCAVPTLRHSGSRKPWRRGEGGRRGGGAAEKSSRLLGETADGSGAAELVRMMPRRWPRGRRSSPRGNANVNGRRRVTMPWQCEVTDCRARTHRWGVPIAGEAVNLGGQETLGDSLAFYSSSL